MIVYRCLTRQGGGTSLVRGTLIIVRPNESNIPRTGRTLSKTVKSRILKILVMIFVNKGGSVTKYEKEP